MSSRHELVTAVIQAIESTSTKEIEREDLTILDWIQQAQQKHIEALLYLQKLKDTLLKAGY